MNLKNMVIAIFVSLAIGFCAGWYVDQQFVKADQLEAATEAQIQTTTEVKESLETSLDVEEKVAASDKQVSKIRSQVAAHLKKEVTNEQSKEGCNSNEPVIDGRTVFLLNSARSGIGIDTTGDGDGEVKTAAPVGLSELIDNDLEVVQLYRELSQRHDSLVDWVKAEVEQRNAK